MNDEEKRQFTTQLMMLEAIRKNHGDTVLKKISDFEQTRMEKVWRRIAEQHGNSLETLVQLLWTEMGAEGGFEFTIERHSTDDISIHCTRCPFADAAREAGAADLGFAWLCMSDYGIVRGFNPAIEFTRTKTCMHDGYCDHRYRVRAEESDLVF